MAYARVRSAGLEGMHGHVVEVEATRVGLADPQPAGLREHRALRTGAVQQVEQARRRIAGQLEHDRAGRVGTQLQPIAAAPPAPPPRQQRGPGQ